MKVSIWGDVGGLDTTANLQAHLDAVEELLPWRFNVMINDISDKRFRCRWSMGALTEWVRGLQALGVTVGFTSWVYPQRDYIEALVREMPRLMETLGVSRVEFDVEGNWKKKHLVGYPSLEKAADALFGPLHEEGVVCEMGATTYTAMVDDIPEVLSWVDEVTVQAYSCAGKPECVWGGRWGPSWHQETSILMARKAMEGGPEGQRLVVGLPAWDQKWDGHSREEALDLEWWAVEGMGVDEVRLWSWAWLVGKSGRSRGSCWGWVRERMGR